MTRLRGFWIQRGLRSVPGQVCDWGLTPGLTPDPFGV